jgi:hypothetical protein
MQTLSSFARFAPAATAAALVLGFAPTTGAQQNDAGREAKPETVMVTYHAQAGSEAKLMNVIARQWETARGLKLVQESPHTTVRGVEQGDKTYLVEIFTWRDASIPDAAPAPLRQLWAEMHDLVEPRGGRPGIDFTEVSLLAP